jgi:asparagine synthase (glutamine-hydrolysing)
MCGLHGGFWRDPPEALDARVLESKSLLRHRGPDDEGQVVTRCVHGTLMLGHTRLSIIDLSPLGHQPMRSDDGRLTVAFNGEIYNYKELRADLVRQGERFRSESDTEVLLKAWAVWGPGSLRRFVGMFAFAIHDANDGSLTLVRDAFGIKPLYYSYDRTSGSLEFASEVPALLRLKGSRPRLNWQRGYEYIVHGLQDGHDGTFIQGIDQLPPAHLLRLELDSVEVSEFRKWWTPPTEQRTGLRFSDCAEALRDLFLRSVRLHLRSDVPVGAALSGGIDSAAVVGGMRMLEPDVPIHTFSFIAAGSEFNEEPWVDLVNERVHAVSHKIRVEPEDFGRDLSDLLHTQGEPFNSTSMYAQYRVFRSAREAGVPVILEGQGADELLAGYHGYPGQRMRSLLERREFVRMFRFAHEWRAWPGRSGKSPWQALAGQLVSPRVHAIAMRFRRAGAHGLVRYPPLRERGVALRTPWLSRAPELKGRRVVEALGTSLTGYELPTLLRFGDRNAMRFSVENRVPFLTIEMAEFLLSMPEHFLISDSGETKSVFRAAMRGIVPDAVLDRRDKIGFVTPMDRWIAGNHASIGQAIRHARVPPFIDTAGVLGALRRVEGEGMSAALWRVINLVQWMDLFDVEAG